MASELAIQVTNAALKPGTKSSHAATADRVDAELQEVREVLDVLRLSRDCWCVTRWIGAHDGRCKRVSVLYQRLRVDGGTENDGTQD
jgi:hypothetical protein